MASSKTFRNTISGVRLRTDYRYSKRMNFDRVIELIVQALKHTDWSQGERKEYRYRANIKSGNPFRTIKFVASWTPGNWLDVVDVPRGGSNDYVTVELPNPYLVKGATLKTAKGHRLKMLYEDIEPEWE